MKPKKTETIIFLFNAGVYVNVMRHCILKSQKAAVVSLSSFQDEMIRQCGFASLYGLLRAFWRHFILRSVMLNFDSFILSLCVTCNIDNRYDSNINKNEYTRMHKLTQIDTNMKKALDLILYVV